MPSRVENSSDDEPAISQTEFTQQHLKMFNEPRFTIKDLQEIVKDITYRKLNDWDSKNLISGSRENEASGWRKFSIVDIVKMQIISDLKSIGLTADKISDIMAKIINYEGTVVSFEKGQFITKKIIDPLGLEYHMVSVWAGEKLLLSISIDPKFDICFQPENAFVANSLHFMPFTAPYLLLPFFEYVKRIFAFLELNIKIDQRSTIAYFITALISYRERKILEILKNKDYTEIKIIRPGSKQEITIHAKAGKEGIFTDEDITDAIHKKRYQNIQIVRKNGQVISIAHEETFKV